MQASYVVRAFLLISMALCVVAMADEAVANGRPGAPSENLYAVDVLDDGRHMWAVGGFGTVFHSADGGLTWEQQATPVLEPLFAIEFVNASTGLAVGKSGVVLRTIDGGGTWERVASGTDKHLFGVAMSDARRGWAVGDWGVMLSTSDGGVSWSDRSLGDDVVLSAVSFADPEHGWIVGEFGTVLATTDGGTQWRRQAAGTDKTLFGVAFTSRAAGWVVGMDGLILRTRDGGSTWEVQRGSATAGSLEDLGFLDLLTNPGLYDVAISEKTGCIVGDTGTVLLTRDGGESWAPHVLPKEVRLFWLRGASMIPGRKGILVGAKGLVVPIVGGHVGQPGTGILKYVAELVR
jgi:photosystem II stability/assembly factor-like uncharacterized protein